MYKQIFLFSVICMLSVMTGCCKTKPSDVLTYSSKKMYGNSYTRQEVNLALDATLNVAQRKIHEGILSEYIYIKEFEVPYENVMLTVNGLGALLDLRDSIVFANKKTVFAYYTDYNVKPCFVNNKLAIYEVLHRYFKGGPYSSEVKYYCFLDKCENTLLNFTDLFKTTNVDLYGLSELIENYLFAYESARHSLPVADTEVLKALGYWVTMDFCYSADYSFNQKEMICVFNENTLGDKSIGVVTLKIPIEEAKPFLSDKLCDLLFEKVEN